MNTFLTVVSTAVCLSTQMPSPAPTAPELVDRYTQALNSLRATIIKAETRHEYDLSFGADRPESFCVLCGQRCKVRGNRVPHRRHTSPFANIHVAHIAPQCPTCGLVGLFKQATLKMRGHGGAFAGLRCFYFF